MKHIPRFYINTQLQLKQTIKFNKEQLHHISNVLKVRKHVILFNDTDGEYLAQVNSNQYAVLEEFIVKPAAMQYLAIGICILRSKEQMRDIISMSAQMDITDIYLLSSQYSNAFVPNYKKLEIYIKESAEQSGKCYIPKLHNLLTLKEFLASNKDNFYIADFTTNIIDKNITKKKDAIIIGPEGGFSENERYMFKMQDNVKVFNLGVSKLRSPTAAVAAISKYLTW